MAQTAALEACAGMARHIAGGRTPEPPAGGQSPMMRRNGNSRQGGVRLRFRAIKPRAARMILTPKRSHRPDFIGRMREREGTVLWREFLKTLFPDDAELQRVIEFAYRALNDLKVENG
jgi:hypothetical protein